MKLKPWHKNKLTYQQFAQLDYDWVNEFKLNSVESFLFRYNAYKKGKRNKYILRSVFGNKSEFDIQQEISIWFIKCIGAYTKIEIKNPTK